MRSNPAIEKLLTLHGVDRDIDKLKSQKELLPVSLRRVKTRLTQQRQALEDKKERIKKLRVESHARENELRAAEQQIEELTRKLNSASSNKEYTALQHELTARRVDSSRLEDQILATMTDIEAVEAEVREIRKNIQQIDREHDEEAGEVEKHASRLDRQIRELQAQRAGAAEAVDEDIRREYERIAARKGSSAVAPVVANTCQGCFMQLPPQYAHNLAAGNAIIHCPSCSRILYLP